MSNTGKSIDQRMDTLERKLEDGFDKLSEEIRGLKIGIHGNEEHDQIGYRQRILALEEKVGTHEEFKKKITWLVSLIGAGASVVINLVIYIVSFL